MSTITREFAEILSAVERPGDFYVTGTMEIFTPQLEVEGVGPVALPLLPVQAKQLIAVADQAPYGRGEQTLVDTNVRRTWQIDANRVRIAGRHWEGTLEAIVARAAEGLGVTAPVVAELYKLLVYDQGSFFVSHRDTEKAPGMFATLVIVLPSLYTGGELLVRHQDRQVRLDLHCPEPSDAVFAAFYADCVHEVRPITSGCRLTLIYNLLRQGKGRLPEPPNYTAEAARLGELLRRWGAGKALSGDEAAEKLIYPLEHAYTPAELSFDALKGRDAAAAGVVVEAAEQADCDVYLALVSIEESGSAEHTGYYSRRRRRWDTEDDEDEYEIGEVYERSETLSDWCRPDGSRAELGDFPFEEDEFSPPDAFQDLEPDEQHFHEATGNEGASFERTYRRAALVLWPRERRLAVLNQAGLSVTLPYLGELASRWAGSGEDQESSLWLQAHELAGYMVRDWPREARHSWRPAEAPSNAAKILNSLSQLKDTVRIDAFLSDILAEGVYSKSDNEAVVRATDLLPPPPAVELITRIIARNAAEALSACGDLLARASAGRDTERMAELIPAAKVLVEALPGDPARAPQPDPWKRQVAVEPSFVVDLMSALCRIDSTLADRAAGHLLSWPAVYGLDSVLIPAVLRLTEQAASRDWSAVQRLRIACLAHLRVRIAEPLQPPRDWRRNNELACKCSHCSELSHFLADPEQQVWTFKAAESMRRHVEDSIRRSRCDLDLSTHRRGRPYSLVCTKNQASYERRVQQREKDLDDLAQLDVPAR